MPVGPYKDFDACVLAMKGKGHDDGEARRICGAMERDMERGKAEMGALDGQWIEIFRAGDYGVKGSYMEKDLDQMAANYDPAHHEAPVVIGHPEHDAPAFGWVQAIKRQGATLIARLGQVQPKFEDWVRAGLFKKRSVAFTRGRDGSLHLRHIGFLGAMPPEVKGLADLKLCEFRDGQFEEVEFINQEEDDVTFDEMKKAMTESLQSIFGGGKDAKPQVFSEDDRKQLVAAAVEQSGKQFTAELGKRDTQIADLAKQLGERTQAEQKSGVTALAEGAVAKLKDAGKWIPAYVEMGVPAIFAELAGSQAKITFGDGDKKREKTPLEVFAGFLDGLPKIVPMAEIAKGASSARRGGKLLQFNEAKGVELDLASVAFSEAAQKRANEKKIPLGDAMRELRAEGFVPVEGGAAANVV